MGDKPVATEIADPPTPGAAISEEGESNSQDPPSHLPTGRLAVFLRLRKDALDARLEALTGRVMSAGERKRLRNFRVRSAVRAVGATAGLVCVIALTAVIIAVILLHGESVPDWVNEVGSALVGISSVLWLYCWVPSKLFDPLVDFARLAARLDCATSTTVASSWNRSQALFMLDKSGRLARIFFRAATGRRLNVSTRPDLVEYVAPLALRIMLVLPDEGLDGISKHPEAASSYGRFIREVAAFLIIERIDLIDELADEYRQPHPELTDELERYLHPLARVTALDALTKYLLPVVAIILSAGALAVAILSP